MTFLFYVVIGLGSSSTVLGGLFRTDCGHGINTVKIVHKNNNIRDNYTVGYVIYPRAVLTVAHRVKDFAPGDLQITNFETSSNGFVRNISRIYIHPKYNSCKGSRDFAILIFKDALPDGYVPICSPPDNFMNYSNVNYDCSPRDYYYSRFHVNTINPEGECSMTVFNFDPEEDITDTEQCLSKERGEITDTIGDRSTVVYICKVSSKNNNDYREYYYLHKYYGTVCTKNPDDTYIIYDGEDLYNNIQPWIVSVTSILLEEDDRPLRIEIPLLGLP